jgi:segregation and condensation protein A
MLYQVQLPQFQGPFDLLLQLIEKEKFDITEISLSKVTDEFLFHLKEVEEIKSEELADFLEVAAKLILYKSKLLLPNLTTDEEEDSGDLINRLKIYQRYALAARKITQIVNQPVYSFSRERIPLEIVPGFSLEVKITPQTLERYFRGLVSILLRKIKITQKIFRQKVVSLKEKISELLKCLKGGQKIILGDLIKEKTKIEKIVMFLATLELAKRRVIEIEQAGLFKDIIVSLNNKN